jgi:hypothetical protein
LDAIVAEDQDCIAFFSWAVDKSRGLSTRPRLVAARAYYASSALGAPLFPFARRRAVLSALGLDRTHAVYPASACDFYRASARALARDLALAFARDLDSCRDLDLTVDRALAFALDLTVDRALAFALDLALDHGRSRALERALGLESALRRTLHRATHVSLALGTHDLHQALSRLTIPALDSAPEDYPAFLDSLQSLMIAHRNVGHTWDFSEKQVKRLIDYFGSNLLLLDCLDLAIVTNRQAMEDTLLLPPGQWTEANILGNQ